MADITRLARIVGSIARNQDLASNTLVVDNLKMKLGTAFYVTFSGAPTAARSISVPDADVNLGHIASLVALSGVAGGSVDLGSFSGTTIPDNSTIKSALQALETAVETAITTYEFSDDVFRIKDDADPTKKIAFQASSINTGVTRTISMPDANVNLADVNQAILADGTRAMAANLSLGNNRITNVASAINGTDAVNLAQLQSYVAGLDWQKDVNDYVADAATTAPGAGLPAAATGQRYILASNTGSLHANWGSISGVGDNDIVEYNGSAWVVAYDVSVQGEGALVWNRAANYFMRWDGSSWAEFGGLSGVTAGAGLDKTGNTIFVDLATDPALEFDIPGDAGKLRVKADNVTLERHSTGLRVKAAGITNNELATNSVATANIQNAAVDKDKLNTNVADQTTLTGGEGTALSVASSPRVTRSLIVGESFAANTTFAVRWGIPDLGETAGRVYKADNDASSESKFYVIGILLPSATALTAGNSASVRLLGTVTLGSEDTNFTSTQQGRPVFLGASGAITSTAPTADNTAVVRLGIAQDATNLFVNPQVVGVN